MIDNNNCIEENTTEIVRTFHESDGQTTNNVNVEQNINVVNIEMGKQSLIEKLDLEVAKEWIQEHMVQMIVGGILIFYTIALFMMMLTVAKYKDIIREEESTQAVTEAVEVITEEPVEVEAETQMVETEIPQPEEVEVIAVGPVACEEELSEEPVTEKALYDMRIVGGTNSAKKATAVNTVGEELEEVFYLTGGFYNETVGFYLNGEYDHFTANLSCDENCKGGFTVNVYLDDGPCLQSIRVQRLMAKTPIDIDTTGATFIKFEITGSMYTQGAILSDGILHIAEVEE